MVSCFGNSSSEIKFLFVVNTENEKPLKVENEILHFIYQVKRANLF